ncbi:MAG: hypothetical protein M1837_000115 [Sclerophora amabilis]|nr:MAG: hypothetical protein M1837_000115 [Sclerophora amabilis]
MTPKVPRAGLGAMHTAGIYSDMSVDGPEIGDLVVIIDKAKNLPNRKTMGKQDPYCAARLGKEAKKTETDKRGGQTPRWDQELRFTVHDSADYYQLKISVFNDDKKTDLIGETFVNLEDVIVLGGGRFDGWNNLNYRGKYAGEIRVELTYYDLRPKVEKPTEIPREVALDGMQNADRDGVGGPRQLKQVKRRPLPADPTNLSSSPSSYSHLDQIQQSAAAQTPSPAYQSAAGSGMDYPVDYSTPEQMMLQSRHRDHPPPSDVDVAAQFSSSQNETFNLREDDYGFPMSDAGGYVDHSGAQAGGDRAPHSYGLSQPPHGIAADGFRHPAEHTAPPPPPVHASRHVRPTPQSSVTTGHQSLPHSHSAPPLTHHQSAPDQRISNASCDLSGPDDEGYTHPFKRESYSHTPLRHQSQDEVYSRQATNFEGRPPPPPAHRSSGGSVTAPHNARQPAYGPMGFPAPLSISPKRATNPAASYNPHGQQRNSYSASSSPRGRPAHHPSGVQTSSRNIPIQPIPPQVGVLNPEPPVRDGGYQGAAPPNVAPGYNMTMASEAVDRTSYERGTGMRSQAAPGFPAAVRASPSHSPHSMVHPDNSATRSRLANGSEAPRAHRSSAPVIKPRAISPDRRSPSRKSVSPAPVASAPERRLSGVPFSPDAYDALNPNATSPGSVEPGSGYQTPEHSRDSIHQDFVDASVVNSDEPIIGSDGRVIDPSDHLPTATWAPEPELKNPQKAGRPELRSRPSPQGAQPMPQSTRRLPREQPARPQSITTPIHVPSPEPSPAPATPSSGGTRNRLQKRVRMQASSPGLAAKSSPLASYDSQKSTPCSLPRRSTDDFALREHENYPAHTPSPTGQMGFGGWGGRGAGTRNSPAAASAAPPLPAKLPLNAGREDHSALSEELKSIDIGSAGRSRIVRRSVY